MPRMGPRSCWWVGFDERVGVAGWTVFDERIGGAGWALFEKMGKVSIV